MKRFKFVTLTAIVALTLILSGLSANAATTFKKSSTPVFSSFRVMQVGIGDGTSGGGDWSIWPEP